MTPKLAELLGLQNEYERMGAKGDFTAYWQGVAYNRALEDAWERMKVCACQVGEGVYWIDTISGTPPAQNTFEGPGCLVWMPKRGEAQVNGVSEATINRFHTPPLPEVAYKEIIRVEIVTTTSGTATFGCSIRWPPYNLYQQWAIEGW